MHDMALPPDGYRRILPAFFDGCHRDFGFDLMALGVFGGRTPMLSPRAERPQAHQAVELGVDFTFEVVIGTYAAPGASVDGTTA
ncbi:hypothetical protein AB0E55_14155 [Amycolatopsis keratiniphila]|uniref:hypothetical protein n=1 Tax=Amycolatopsis keratiniphila TaxID=129921 RepID=UPI0033F48CAE